MHDGRVTSSENTTILQQVQDVDLTFEFLDSVDMKIFMANNISIHYVVLTTIIAVVDGLPSEHVHISNTLELDIDVLAGLGGKDFLFVDGDGGDFGLAAVGH